MDSLDVPEMAVQAFEKIHGLRVTIHDLQGSLRAGISRERSRHLHPLCRCVKAGLGEWPCINFEVIKLRAELPSCPDGRYHVCHAGFVEWVVPVYNELALEWVIFAGVRTPGKSLGSVLRAARTRWSEPPWDAHVELPSPVDEPEAVLILEHLRQLATRLQAWVRRREKQVLPARKTDAFGETLLTRRRTLIQRYIAARHTQNIRLRDLAVELGVSEDRATHLIRECCGRTFREMLVEARVRTAKELLSFSSLPILQIALSSGFQEISHFNRLFRQRTGQTPGQYRREAAAVD